MQSVVVFKEYGQLSPLGWFYYTWKLLILQKWRVKKNMYQLLNRNNPPPSGSLVETPTGWNFKLTYFPELWRLAFWWNSVYETRIVYFKRNSGGLIVRRWWRFGQIVRDQTIYRTRHGYRSLRSREWVIMGHILQKKKKSKTKRFNK